MNMTNSLMLVHRYRRAVSEYFGGPLGDRRSCVANVDHRVGPEFFRLGNHSRGRLHTTFLKQLRIAFQFPSDNVFKARVQGLIGLNFTFGCAPKCCRREQIISQPVFRNEIIVLDDFCCWKFNYDDKIGR